jgi:hypothetical protein
MWAFRVEYQNLHWILPFVFVRLPGKASPVHPKVLNCRAAPLLLLCALQIPGVPIMYISQHRYSIERLPEATIGGAPRT